MKKSIAKVLLAAMSLGLVSAMAAQTPNNATKTPAKAPAKGVVKEQSFDGWVSDEKCGARIDADCARKCEAAGVKMVFVDSNKNIVPVTNGEKLKGFSGQHVNIKGKLENGALTVVSIKAAPVDRQL